MARIKTSNSMIIYNVKKVSFEQGERDPFGFDDFTEKLSVKYLPFSGSVRKPAYFLFVGFVNRLLLEKFKEKTKKEKNEMKIRLEKLLVYSWKNNGANLRGANIIGNSFNINDIDPFSGKGWIKQNCFKIYSSAEAKFVPVATIKKYWEHIGKKEAEFLCEFLSKNYTRGREKEDYLESLLKKLNKKNSLFSGHLLYTIYKNAFKKELENKILNNDSYYKIVSKFFNHKSINEKSFWNSTLDNTKLPFQALNKWFSLFVNAVDADINELKSTSLWSKADAAYIIIPDNIKRLDRIIKLERQPKPKTWFSYDGKKYLYCNDKAKTKILWESYKKRQGEDYNRYFFNFRHYAFLNLLKELK